LRTRDCVLQTEASIDLVPDAATLYDLSRYQTNGAINVATWEQLPSGLWVLDMAGNSYVNFGSPRNLDLTNTLSFECWFYHDNITGQHAFMGGNATVTWDTAFSIFVRNVPTNIRYAFNEAGTRHYYSFVVPDIEGAWHHLVMVYSGGGGAQSIYLDSIAYTNAPASAAVGRSYGNVYIGYQSGLPAPIYFGGKMGLWRFYNYVITHGQVRNNYEKTKHWFGVHD